MPATLVARQNAHIEYVAKGRNRLSGQAKVAAKKAARRGGWAHQGTESRNGADVSRKSQTPYEEDKEEQSERSTKRRRLCEDAKLVQVAVLAEKAMNGRNVGVTTAHGIMP